MSFELYQSETVTLFEGTKRGESSSSLCMWSYHNQRSNSWLTLLIIFYNSLVHPWLITIMYEYVQCLIGKESPQFSFIYLHIPWNVVGIDDTSLCVSTYQMFYNPKWDYMYVYANVAIIPYHMIDNPLYYSWSSLFFRKYSFRILIRWYFHVGSWLWMTSD